MKRSSSTNHSSRPFVHNLHESDLVLFLEFIVRHAIPILFLFDLISNPVNHLQALFELFGNLGLRVRLFDKDEYG